GRAGTHLPRLASWPARARILDDDGRTAARGPERHPRGDRARSGRPRARFPAFRSELRAARDVALVHETRTGHAERPDGVPRRPVDLAPSRARHLRGVAELRGVRTAHPSTTRSCATC